MQEALCPRSSAEVENAYDDLENPDAILDRAQSRKILAMLPDEVKSDRGFALGAVQRCHQKNVWMLAKALPDNVKDVEFATKALDKCHDGMVGTLMQHLPEGVKDREFALKAIEKCPQEFLHYLMKHLPATSRRVEDKAQALLAVEESWRIGNLAAKLLPEESTHQELASQASQASREPLTRELTVTADIEDNAAIYRIHRRSGMDPVKLTSFSQLSMLQRTLEAEIPNFNVRFPSKTSHKGTAAEFVESRRQKIQQYLRVCTDEQAVVNSRAWKNFFVQKDISVSALGEGLLETTTTRPFVEAPGLYDVPQSSAEMQEVQARSQTPLEDVDGQKCLEQLPRERSTLDKNLVMDASNKPRDVWGSRLVRSMRRCLKSGH